MLRSLARILLIVAFLAAQTAGIAHQAWHDAGAQVAHAAIDGAADGKAPKKNQLCDFHTALGSVLGALGNAQASLEFGFQDTTRFAAAGLGAARFSLLASRSRGPPALL